MTIEKATNIVHLTYEMIKKFALKSQRCRSVGNSLFVMQYRSDRIIINGRELANKLLPFLPNWP